MFSGIIQTVGKLVAIDESSDNKDKRFVIYTPQLAAHQLKLGASVACDGACMTVVDCTPQDGVEAGHNFAIDVSSESLQATNLSAWQIGDAINLEPALTLAQAIDGHLVTGHVDGLARLKSRTEIAGSVKMVFSFPKNLQHLIAMKGSVALNGVSLTVNFVSDIGNAPEFHCNIIPHTLEATNLGTQKIGNQLNLEIDLIARYLERVLLAKPSKIG